MKRDLDQGKNDHQERRCVEVEARRWARRGVEETGEGRTDKAARRILYIGQCRRIRSCFGWHQLGQHGVLRRPVKGLHQPKPQREDPHRVLRHLVQRHH
jgi:hypothetical protein